MDRKEFEDAFDSEDKRLWRKINRSGAFSRKKKKKMALTNSTQIEFNIESIEKTEFVEEESPSISNISEYKENYFVAYFIVTSLTCTYHTYASD